MMFQSLILLTILVCTVFGQNEFCDMCEGAGSPRNPELIVPFLAIGPNDNPTCQEIHEFAKQSVPANDDTCSLIKSHKDFCGCEGAATRPINACSLCLGGATPVNLNAKTPFGDSCSELNTYLKYLPKDLCLTERVGSIMRVDAFCGCPGVKADCYMCDDDSNDLLNPDRKVPFYEFLGNSFSSTCQDLADFYTLYDTNDSEITTCQFVKIESGYCGCKSQTDTSPVNACKLCSDGSTPAKGNKFIEEFNMTCSELELYMNHSPADQCDMPWIADFRRFDYFCGCKNATAECPICPDGSIDLSNPEAIIPYLIIPNNENPTCHQLATLGVIAEPGELVQNDCSVFESQADFCGCPGASKPEVSCDFCPEGDSPSNLDLITPFGDSCKELSEYLSFLPTEECDSERVGYIKRQDFLCGCPSATTSCALCSDHGSNDVAYSDRHIPFLTLPLNSNPTCGEVVDFVAVNDGDLSDAGCSALQQYQGYCGCPDYPVKNECSFCPFGGTPTNPNKVISDVFTCGGLYDFVSYLRKDECTEDSSDFKQFQAFAYVCGCPNTQPSCTLCPSEIALPSPSTLTGEKEGSTCEEYAEYVTSLTVEQCIQQNSEIQATASVCGCGSPVAAPSVVATQFDDDDVGKTPNSSAPNGKNQGLPPKQNSTKTKEISESTNVIIIAVTVPVVLALLVVIYYFATRNSAKQENKMVAELDGNEDEDPVLPIQDMEGSMSMSDVPIKSPRASSRAAESFSIDEDEIIADTAPDNKIV